MGQAENQSVTFRDARSDDADWLVARHEMLYREEYGFDAGFAPVVRRVLADYFRSRDPTRERAWVPLRDGARVGSLFCVQGAVPDQARLRLFWLEPEARGQGLAQRMLGASLRFAREAGYREIVVATYEAHVAAGRLYARAGFTLTQSRPVQNFGQALVEQSWRRAL